MRNGEFALRLIIWINIQVTFQLDQFQLDQYKNKNKNKNPSVSIKITNRIIPIFHT
jgi:hypothetical protein